MFNGSPNATPKHREAARQLLAALSDAELRYFDSMPRITNKPQWWFHAEVTAAVGQRRRHQ